MRVNIYAEEMTEIVEVITKEINGHKFTGLRFYLHLPVTVGGGEGKPVQVRGPFMHHPDDDDSSAVTFWGKRDLRVALRLALDALDEHYAPSDVKACLNCGRPALCDDGRVWLYCGGRECRDVTNAPSSVVRPGCMTDTEFAAHRASSMSAILCDCPCGDDSALSHLHDDGCRWLRAGA